jgi:mannose-6-phosphate isomerase-like protein (cupin superfamily)
MTMAVACAAPRVPQLVWEGAGAPRVAGSAEWAGTLAERQPGVRVGVWGASPDASFQLIEAHAPERPHVHESHDLTVVLLQGQGVLRTEERERSMAAGDVAHVGRGRVHWFEPTGREPALALAIFTPALSGPDYHEPP